jgi:hypothetical protein
MHPLLQPLFYYLWVAPHVLQAIVLLLMLRRKLHKQFPMFLLYTAFELFQFIVLFTVGRSGSFSAEQYRSMFSLGSAISTGLRFAIIYEIFTHVFRSYPRLSGLGRVLSRWATVALLLFGVALAAATHGNGAYSSVVLLSVLDRTISILQCGLLMLLFLVSRHFALSWRNYAFGLALGFGVFASVELATSAIRSQIGSSRADFIDLVVMAAYHCCVLIWIFYLVAPERITYRTPNKLPEDDLGVWNEELQRLLQQ